jgi:hypothetical protein
MSKLQRVSGGKLPACDRTIDGASSVARRVVIARGHSWWDIAPSSLVRTEWRAIVDGRSVDFLRHRIIDHYVIDIKIEILLIVACLY